MSLIGDKFYYIDKPNNIYEVVKKSNSFYYVAYFHPTFGDIKALRDEDIGKTFFLSREEMLDARIERARRILELEITCKERKI